MNKLKISYISLVVLLITSCNSDDKIMDRLEQMALSEESSDYQLELAYATFVMQDMGDLESRISLVRDLLSIHAFSQARYCIDHLLESEIKSPELFYLKAVCYRNEHHYSLAIDAISRAIGFNSGNETYRREKSNIEEEYSLWNEIGELSDIFKEDRFNAQLVMNRAEKYILIRMFDAAIYDASQVYKLDTTNSDALFLQALAYLFDTQYTKSVDLFSKLMGMQYPSEMEILYNKYSQKVIVLNALEAKINSSPDEAENYIQMSRELSILGEYDRALKIISDGILRNEDNLSLLQGRMLIYIQKDDMDNARKTASDIEGMGMVVDSQLLDLLNK